MTLLQKINDPAELRALSRAELAELVLFGAIKFHELKDKVITKIEQARAVSNARTASSYKCNLR